MALTVAASPNNFLQSSQEPFTVGARRVWLGTLAGDASYPTGGYTLDPNLIGLDRVAFILAPAGMVPGGTAVYWVWNATTSKLQAFAPAGTEKANTTNLSAVLATVLVVGY